MTKIHLKKLGIFFACVLMGLVIGFSYAYQQKEIFQKMSGNVMGIDEDAYGDTNFDSKEVYLSPILDSEVEKRSDRAIAISFRVGGSKDNHISGIIYDVALMNLEVDCDLLSPDVKWKLVKNGKEISEGSLDYQFDTIVGGRMVLTNIQQDLVPYEESKENYDTYFFYLWLSDSCQEEDIQKCLSKREQKQLMQKKIKGKIEVELYVDNKFVLERKPQMKLDRTVCN